MVLRIAGLVLGISGTLLLACHAYYYLSGQASPLHKWLGLLILMTIMGSSLLRMARRRSENQQRSS